MDLLEDDGSLATSRRLWDLEPERLARRKRLLDQFEALDLLQLAHGLRSLGSDLTESVIELAQVGDLLLLVLVGSIMPLVTGIPFLQEGAVVSGIGVQATLGDLIHGLDDLIHELPVVGDQEHGAGIGLQVILEPKQGD